MNAAFLIPGFSPDLTFESSTLDTLRDAMNNREVVLYGVSEAPPEIIMRKTTSSPLRSLASTVCSIQSAICFFWPWHA